MIQHGVIKSWNDSKGFGFISADATSRKIADNVFIHITGFSDKGNRPQINQAISYHLTKDNNGRVHATKAKLIGVLKRRGSVSMWDRVMIAFSLVFLAVTAGLVFIKVLSPIILIVYLTFSTIAFFIFRQDKLAATSRRWRTSENALHSLSLIGGWPGSVMAQKIFRHKSKKTSFRVVSTLTIMTNLAFYYWLFTPEGKSIFGYIDFALLNFFTEVIEQLKAITL